MTAPQKAERMIDPTRQLTPSLLGGRHIYVLKLSKNRNGGLHARGCQSDPQIIKSFLHKLTLVPVETPSIPLEFRKHDTKIITMGREGGREKQYVVHVINHLGLHPLLDASHRWLQRPQKFVRTVVIPKR